MHKLYGSLALVPIGMIWIYYSWVIVIFGAELVYVLHNVEQMQAEARKRWLIGKGQAPLSRRAALTLLRDLFRDFEAAGGPVSSSDLASRYMVHAEQADSWFAALEGAGLVARMDGGLVVPTKPSSSVTVGEVWGLYTRTFEQNLPERGTGCEVWSADGGLTRLDPPGDRTFAEVLSLGAEGPGSRRLEAAP